MNQEQINQVEKLAQAASDMKLMLVIYPGPVLDLVFLVERLRAENERLKAELARYKEVVGATLDDEAGDDDPANWS